MESRYLVCTEAAHSSGQITLQLTFQNIWQESPEGLLVLPKDWVSKGVKGLGMAVK